MQSVTQQRRLQVLANHLLTAQQAHIGPNQTCGIIAVVAHEPVSKFLLEGLKILEARGYDSAGISTVHTNSSELITTKHASKGATNNAIELLSKDLAAHGDAPIGIAHTRWATHGGAADHNAHPHLDQSGRIAVVHNGVIENYAALKTFLKEEHQVVFRSETDTEVIAQLIGIYVKSGKNVVEATQSALAKLEGTWGLVVLDRLNPTKLVVAKNGSPMLIGIGSDKTFVSSESVAFSRHTKAFIALEDNEIAVLTPESHSLELSRIRTMEQQEIATSPDPYPHWTLKGEPEFFQTPSSAKSRVQTIQDPEVVLLTPEPFSSWTEREIMEQPESLSRALNYGGRLHGEDSVKLGGLSSNHETIGNIKHLVIAACGTSLFAGLFGSHLMRFLDSFETVQVIDAAELEDFHLPNPATGGMLVISQSGETKDVHRALVMAQEKGLPVISVVNAVGSLIARSTSCGIYLNAGRENAVASTKAFTSQATVLALLGLWFSEHSQGKSSRLKRKAMVDALHRLPTSVGMTTTKEIRRQCKTIAERLFQTKCEHLFVLGKGPCMSIAYEGALKIKEISYVHAEGYAGGALKHGPFALIEPGTPIIFLMIDDHHAPKMRTAIEEVSARGAYPITITNIHDPWKGYSKNMGDIVTIPSNGALTALLAVIPLQFIAYELSVLKGINPDRPRHLAKTVTVD